MANSRSHGFFVAPRRALRRQNLSLSKLLPTQKSLPGPDISPCLIRRHIGISSDQAEARLTLLGKKLAPEFKFPKDKPTVKRWRLLGLRMVLRRLKTSFLTSL